MSEQEKLKIFIDYYLQKIPNPTTELKYKNEFELTVAVILSAQCTDKRVNQITPDFFKKFQSFNELSEAKFEEVYELIKSCSYPNNKTKALIELSKKIVNEYNGKLPQDNEELLKLPGIGRKTANVLLSVLYNKPLLAVDTHVYRVSHRLGLVSNKANNPLKVEKEIYNLVPDKKVITKLHHWLILHGRYVCKAKKPLCEECAFKNVCEFFNKDIPIK